MADQGYLRISSTHPIEDRAGCNLQHEGLSLNSLTPRYRFHSTDILLAEAAVGRPDGKTAALAGKVLATLHGVEAFTPVKGKRVVSTVNRKFWPKLIWVLLFIGAITQAHGEIWQFARDRRRRPTPPTKGRTAAHAGGHRRQQVAFIAHIGDIKSRTGPLRRRAFHGSPATLQCQSACRSSSCLVTTSGPTAAGSRMAPTIRWNALHKLRSLFWQRPDSLGRKTLPLERQPGTIRNIRDSALGRSCSSP